MSLPPLRLLVDELGSGASGSEVGLVSGMYWYIGQAKSHEVLLNCTSRGFPLTPVPCCFVVMFCDFDTVFAGSVFDGLAMLSPCFGELEVSSVEQDW